MNKWLAVISLFIVSTLSYGQHYVKGLNNVQIPIAKVYTLESTFLSEASLTDYLTHQHDIVSLPAYNVVNTSVRRSLTGIHYTYKVFKDNLPIYGVQIRVHTTLDGAVRFVQDNVPLISEVHSGLAIEATFDTWMLTNDGWQIASLIDTQDEFGTQSVQIEGVEIGVNQTKLFYTLPDTQVKAQVFLVNPLNTAERNYGSPYIDSSDLDVPQLNAERKWVNMAVHFENNKFSLKTDRYYFGHISNPTTAPTTTTTDTFSFLRSQHQFEDVNAFYHITNMSNYVDSLGFESALPDALIIDAHGYNGGDFSSFNYGVLPIELEFGEGGVDDAEDGEIVVHEFSHALAFIAGGDSYSGDRDRAAMEEGNADYFSTSYSKSYTDYAWDTVFNWDWGPLPKDVPDILIGTLLQYPQDMTGNTNADREMWSTPLMCLYDKIGRGPSDSLVLEHLFYQYKGATIPEMAAVLLVVDSLMFQKKYHHDIRNCFAKQNILLSSEKSLEFSQLFEAHNTIGFSMGTESAIIFAKQNQPFEYTIFDNLGRTLVEKQSSTTLRLSPESYKSGIYFVELKIDGFTSYLKVMKY
ncbi:MAG: hypothetical protein ACI9JN_001691 [Bacteroidia bacterium]|jgi:hypothetical protein